MGREIKVAHREAILVMSKRLPVWPSEIASVLGTAFGEVYGYLQERGIEPDGPPFVIYHGIPAVEDFEMEICAPVARAADPPAGWRFQKLPAGLFATILHVGPYDTVPAAYPALTEWLGAHEYVVTGPPREVYLSEPDTPPAQIRTVIEFPVSEVVAPIATA